MAEMPLVGEEFAGYRLVSVLGVGGTGKTRFALRFGWTWLGDFPGGVWFCDLSQARSIDGIVSATGYGLVVHGFTTKDGQFEDYAFLISNADSPKYRIVMHKNGKETNVVEPTTSTTIRTGTSPNQLEVRIRDLKMDFYVNGQFVTSIVDEANFRKGLVGFYDSGPGEVAFDDLEISK